MRKDKIIDLVVDVLFFGLALTWLGFFIYFIYYSGENV